MAKKIARTLRIADTGHPLLYEVNARVLLRELSAKKKRKVTLGTIPEELIDEWANLGFDAVWLMGVWTTGETGRAIARDTEVLGEEYRKALPDFRDEDIGSSPYAIKAYTVSPALGGNEGLETLRQKLARRGLALVLDFVANHTARDCEWVTQHPEYYVAGPPDGARKDPASYFAVKTKKGERTLAFGRDPLYPGWTDTAQVNVTHPAARKALIRELEQVTSMCDGVRCDMAMLLLKDVFAKTWADRMAAALVAPAEGEFWKEAIDKVRESSAQFLFIAEVYWNREWDLQQLGFDYTYDKVFYERLLKEGAASSRDHLNADIGFQRHAVRFLENHDEVRVAQALNPEAWHFAAAVICLTVPGMVLLHDGQLDGRRVKVPVQLLRRPNEARSDMVRVFYERLLSCVVHPVFRTGSWKLIPVRPAWHDNQSWQNFLIFWWNSPKSGTRLVVVNFAPRSGQCYAEVPVDLFDSQAIEFRDLLGHAVYVREKTGLMSKGLYFDLPGYGMHLFEVNPVKK